MRDILIALSLANLLFLRGWEKFRFGGFLNDLKPDGPGVAISVVVTTALLWIFWRLARANRKLNTTAKISFLLLLLIPVNGLRLYFDQAFRALYGPKYQWLFWMILALLVLPVIIAAARRRLSFRFLLRYGIVLVLALAPFTLFTVGGVLFDSYRAFRAARETPYSASTVPAQKLFPKTRQRVVWIIFDELDNRVAFRERPASLSLPEFDRFRAQSLVATAAYPPGGQTGQSVPAFLNGMRVAGQLPLSETRMAIQNEGQSSPEIWNSGMTIFAETSAAGIKTALAGVYFPYCAILGRTVTDCRDFRSFRRHASFMTRLKVAVMSSMDALPFTYRLWLRKAQRRDEIYRYQYTAQQASLLAADQSYDLVYIHFPIPHPPPIYDRHTARVADSGEHSYVDNLALADVALGEVRRAMEQSGAWEKSTVIVTSDHWWRTSLWRSAPFWSREAGQVSAGKTPDHNVPFMLKLTGKGEYVVYDRPFNTVIMRKMIMTMLNEGIRTNVDLIRWLDQNAIGPIEPLIAPEMY